MAWVLGHLILGNVDSFLYKFGYEEEVVNEVYDKIMKNEYKRRQAPIGVRISNKAFGTGRRFPIVNQYREKNK